VSKDVTLTSDTLDMRFANREMERVFAWGQSRARAVSPEYDIVAEGNGHVPHRQDRIGRGGHLSFCDHAVRFAHRLAFRN
jgi:hypothetical protein